jgi:hydrogenase assembly chaperone HypC/HupF
MKCLLKYVPRKNSMCLAVPMKIVKIEGTSAVVEAMGVERTVDLSLIENPEINDKVIIHAGFAIEKLDPETAEEIESTWNEYIEFMDKDNK